MMGIKIYLIPLHTFKRVSDCKITFYDLLEITLFVIIWTYGEELWMLAHNPLAKSIQYFIDSWVIYINIHL